jgi:hypothetical protein
MADFFFQTSSARKKFEDGWDDYVKPRFTFPQTPVPLDVYWNPRAPGWFTYSSAAHDIQDKGWPKIDLSGFLVPSSVYDQITDQYLTLTSTAQPYACWDPRRGQWMSVASRKPLSSPSPSDEKAAALDAVQKAVTKLFHDRFIRQVTLQEITKLLNSERN